MSRCASHDLTGSRALPRIKRPGTVSVRRLQPGRTEVRRPERTPCAAKSSYQLAAPVAMKTGGRLRWCRPQTEANPLISPAVTTSQKVWTD